MAGQNFIHMQILMAGSGTPQMPLFMISTIVKRKGEKPVKAVGKLEDKYMIITTRVCDISDFTGRAAGMV